MLLSFGFSTQLIASDQEEWENLYDQSFNYFESEQYEEAIDSATQAAELATEAFGETHPQTILSVYQLASFYLDLGYPEEAASIFQQVVDLATDAFGVGSPEAVMISFSYARSLTMLGDYNLAQGVLETVLADVKQNDTLQSPEGISVMSLLAQIYQAQGEYDSAEALFQEAISVCEEIYGADHIETLINEEYLASVYQSQTRFSEAESLYQKVLLSKETLFGPDDPETLLVKGSLAELYREMAIYDTAEDLFREAIDQLIAVVGDQDPDVYDLMGKLAQLYQERGKYNQAEELFTKVWEYDRDTLGEDHPNTIIDYNSLAGIYRLKGEYGKAEAAYLDSLDRMTQAFGDKHPETITITNNLALLFENEGLFDKAEPLYKTALNNAKEVLGEEHPTTLALMNNLAALYESQGAFDKSEPLYLEAIQLNEEVYGEDHPNTIAGVNNLGYLYLMRGEYDRAEPLFSRVLTNWRTQLGDHHQRTLKALNNLARVYHQQGKLPEAEDMFDQALAMRKEALGAKHPDVVRSMVDLSSLYITQNQLGKAESLLRDTILLSEEILGETHQYTFEAYNLLADLYELKSEFNQALQTRKTIFERRNTFFERVLWAAGENTRQGYIELHKPEQDRYLALLSKLGTKEAARQALQVSLSRKGLLLKISSEIHRIVQLSNSPTLSQKAKALDSKRKELASLTLSGPVMETPEAFRKKIARLESELYDLQAELSRASMIYQAASSHVNVDEVFKNLEADEVLVDYLTYNDNGEKIMAVVAQTTQSSCYLWWKCQKQQIDLIPIGALGYIQQVVSIYRETIQDEMAEEIDLLETGQEAYSTVWRPIKETIGQKKSVYLVPDSVLHLLPFDALVDDDEWYLLQTKDIKVMSSARDLVVAPIPKAEGEFMIMAGPDYDLEDVIKDKKPILLGRRSAVTNGIRVASTGLRSLSFEPLEGAELEGKTIKEVSDSFVALEGAEEEGLQVKELAEKGQGQSIIYLQREAEENKLRGITKAPEKLHIATHGFFLKAEERLKKRLLSLNRGGTMLTPPPGDNPLLRAGLAFAGINANAPFLGEIDTDNDGVLTAMEVLSLNLTGTQLVVLSACETGVGEIHAGEGVYGLRRSFQEAGVKSVVNSLWPVSDEGTRRLMTAFYTHLYEGKEARVALKEAQLSMIDSSWNNPYYWAAFVLVERRYSAIN